MPLRWQFQFPACEKQPDSYKAKLKLRDSITSIHYGKLVATDTNLFLQQVRARYTRLRPERFNG